MNQDQNGDKKLQRNDGSEKMKVNIIIDKRCNQKCKYCEHSHNIYPERTDEEIFESFDLVMNKLEDLFGKNAFRPQLQGGEPTLLSNPLTDAICERLEGYDEVLVFSNGYDRNSRFYREANYKVITHIIDWYGCDISKFPIQDNETLAFCICHDEIWRVENLLSTRVNEKVLLLPCWSDNPAWNCTSEDKIYLSDLQNKLDGIDKNSHEHKNNLCSSMRIPLVDCMAQTITPCGFVPNEKPINKVTPEEFKRDHPCAIGVPVDKDGYVIDEGCGLGEMNISLRAALERQGKINTRNKLVIF